MYSSGATYASIRRTSEIMYNFLAEIIVWHKFETPKGWGGHFKRRQWWIKQTESRTGNRECNVAPYQNLIPPI